MVKVLSAASDPVTKLEREFLQKLTVQPYLPVLQVIDSLLVKIEEAYPGAICSILKLSPDNTLLHYSAPHLPKEYIGLINGHRPGPMAGSCGTAVFYDETIIVADTFSDPLWKDYAGIARSFGLGSCWSMPIHYSSGAILGTFAIYHAHHIIPSGDMLWGIERLSNLIGLVIENREMMENLRISKERYNVVSLATHDTIWDWDLLKNEIFRNDEDVQNVYGFVTNEPIRKMEDWFNRIHPDDRSRVNQEIGALRQSADKKGFEVEYRFLKDNDEYIYIHDRGYIMRDACGSARRVIGAAKDVTRQVKERQLLEESEERYRNLFQTSPLPTWIFDLDTTRFLEVNDAAIRHYGYSLPEFVRMSIFDVGPPWEQVRLKKVLGQERIGKKQYLWGRWQHRKKNGDIISVDIVTHKLMYKGRKAILVVVNDITENLRMQEQLIVEKAQRQKEIMKATILAQEKEREEIAYELNDNVNQILTSAKLYIECVGRYDTQKEEYRNTGIGLIMQAIDEVRSICRTMAPPRLHDIGLINAMADLMQQLHRVNNIEVEFRYDHFSENTLNNDLKLAIYRIAQQQIAHVIKYAGAGKFSVRLSREAEYIQVIMHDNGKGSDPDQLKSSTSLINIMSRASVHNGEIHIESTPGSGCSIGVCFPCKDSS